MLELKKGAVLVADAHYASYRPTLELLVDKIISKEIKTTQLLLMGDIFDLLMGPIKAFKENEQRIIEKLNRLSQEMEVVYFEGNHDFQLRSIFPAMTIYPLAQQPVKALFENQEGFLAHGDWGDTLTYRVYSWIIRNRVTLSVLNCLDRLTKRNLSNLFYKKMQNKHLCSDFKGFENYIARKFERKRDFYGWFIEGHYHQGSRFLIDGMHYQNLEAMACNKSYFVVQSNLNVISLSGHTL